MTSSADACAVRVVWSSEDVAVVDKPAGMPTEPDRAGRLSLREALMVELRAQGSHREVPHAASRLDLPVSGAVTFALTERAKRALAPGGDARLAKLYVALLAGPLEGERVLSSPVDGRAAETRARAVASAVGGSGIVTLALLEPITGRKHQLRVHAALAGAPIIGERRHGEAARVVTSGGAVLAPGRLMLHAFAVWIDWHVLGAPVRIIAPLPSAFRGLWSALGGASPALLEIERSCETWPGHSARKTAHARKR